MMITHLISIQDSLALGAEKIILDNEKLTEATAQLTEVTTQISEVSTNALFTGNNVWMMVCTALVFFMHMGFSLLETGLTRQKNTVNILFKNFFIICIGLVLYALIGFNLMYPSSFWHGVIPDYFVGLFGLESPQNAEGLDLTYNT